MTNKIGEKIKILRKKTNITQERFAEYLGITFQSVSRWESGICYPDLEILPAIANYFNVTTDELLGVDIMNKKEKIKEICNQVHINFNKGLIDENIEILRTAVNEFPNEYDLLSNLAFYLSIKDDTRKESISIYERIMEDYPDKYYEITQHLSLAYKRTGEKEKAIEIAKKLPQHISCEDLLSLLYDGEELHNHLRWHLMELCEMFAKNIGIFARANYGETNERKKIELYDKAINIYNIIYEEGDYGFYNERMGEFYADKAISYMLLNDYDNTLDCLEKAANYMIAYDTLPEVYTYTSKIPKGYIFTKATDAVTNHNSNNSYQLLHNYVFHERYNPLRKTERFKAIVAKLEQYAKKVI